MSGRTQAKMALYRQLLSASPDDLTDGEVELMTALSADRDIQAVLQAALLHIHPQPNHPGRWISTHRPGLSFPSEDAARADAGLGKKHDGPCWRQGCTDCGC